MGHSPQPGSSAPGLGWQRSRDSAASSGTRAHSAAGGQGDKHRERAWLAATGTRGPTSGPGPILSLSLLALTLAGQAPSGFHPGVWGRLFGKILFLFSDAKPPSPDPAAHSSTTHDTRPGRNGRREPLQLGNRISREAVKGVSFQRKRVRSQKHSYSQRQAAHAFPQRHFKFPAEPCLPGVCTPHSAFLRADPAPEPSGCIEATHVCFRALLNRAGHCADLPARWPEFQTEQAHTADCSLPRSGHRADTVQQ